MQTFLEKLKGLREDDDLTQTQIAEVYFLCQQPLQEELPRPQKGLPQTCQQYQGKTHEFGVYCPDC